MVFQCYKTLACFLSSFLVLLYVEFKFTWCIAPLLPLDINLASAVCAREYPVTPFGMTNWPATQRVSGAC